MKKIAIILPYLKDTDGKEGVVDLLKKYQGISAILDKFEDDIFIQIITTTSTTSKAIWENKVEPGFVKGADYEVLRFTIDEGYAHILRDGNTYDITGKITAMKEYTTCCEKGPVSKELFNYVRLNNNRYNAIFFWGLEYYTASIVMNEIENAVLIPRLSSKGETLLKQGFYRNAIRNAIIVTESKDERNFWGEYVSPSNVICIDDISEDKIIPILDTHEEYVYDGIIENGISPAFEENNVGIVLASDENYVPFLCVAIKSIVECASEKNNYDIIVLSDEIKDVTRVKIQKMAESGNVSVRFVEISCLLKNYTFSFRCQQLSRSTFARMLLPDMLMDYAKVLYLDCDIIVRNDVAELFAEDIEGYCLAAVRDRYVSILRGSETAEYNHIKNNVKLSDDQDYFNAGILLLNLHEFRQKYTTSYMMELAVSRTWMWEDQDVLNYLCKGFVKWISPKWNMLWGLDLQLRDMMLMEREYFDSYNNPSIIHYAGGCLPTKTLDDRKSVEFWNVARQTPYYEALIRLSNKNDIQSIVDNTISQKCLIGNSVDNSEIQNANIMHEVVMGKGIKRIIKKIVVKCTGSICRESYEQQKQFKDKTNQLLEKIERMQAER